jgi:hypothetical protein
MKDTYAPDTAMVTALQEMSNITCFTSFQPVAILGRTTTFLFEKTGDAVLCPPDGFALSPLVKKAEMAERPRSAAVFLLTPQNGGR